MYFLLEKFYFFGKFSTKEVLWIDERRIGNALLLFDRYNPVITTTTDKINKISEKYFKESKNPLSQFIGKVFW